MPLQNRVTPFGEIIATPERGLMFGNRGTLHNQRQQIVRHHVGQRWIACVLEFKGRHRAIMQPNRYTELFFLDEATALAAGHRPCAECRRADYNAFRRHWLMWDTRPGWREPSADEMDMQLQADRLVDRRTKRTYQEEITALADGVFILHEGVAWLLWQWEMLHWTLGGYDRRLPRPAAGIVTVLTPRSIARTLAAGYVPAVHPSAQTLSPDPLP